MSIRPIFADVTVSISELRKKPQEYFTDHAVAVLSNNRPVGYLIGAEAYENLVSILTYWYGLRASRIAMSHNKSIECARKKRGPDAQKTRAAHFGC